MESMKIVESERLYLREITMNDTESLFAVLSDREVMRYSFRGVCSRKEIENYIEDCIINNKKYGLAQWAVIQKKNNAFIGVCGLNPGFNGDKSIIHIAARFTVASWGMGFASEALKAVLGYAKSTLKLKRVFALVEPANKRSVNIVLNNAFKLQKQSVYKQKALNYYLRLL